MKVFAILVTILITCVGCNCQKKAAESATVVDKQAQSEMQLEYTANTRGFYQKITIQNQQLYVSKDRDTDKKGAFSKISDADWNALMGYFETIKLAQLADLKSPTEKRFYDGAAIANLKVTYKGKDYVTTDFDHGFPPAEIKNLVDKITSFVKKE